MITIRRKGPTENGAMGKINFSGKRRRARKKQWQEEQAAVEKKTLPAYGKRDK